MSNSTAGTAMTESDMRCEAGLLNFDNLTRRGLWQSKDLSGSNPLKQIGDFCWREDDDSLLGEGTYGAVYRGNRRSTNELIAVKKLKLRSGAVGNDDDSVESRKKNCENELKHWQLINHKNIVRVIDAIHQEGLIFMEFVEGKPLHITLQQLHEPLTIEQIRSLSRQLVSAVEHLHSRDVIHCDIKPSNIIMAGGCPSGELKLVDFGLSRGSDARPSQSSSELLGPGAGTLGFTAPEVLLGKKNTKMSDMWSVGAVIMACIKAPLREHTEAGSTDEFLPERLNMAAIGKEMNHCLSDFLFNRCLIENYRRRSEAKFLLSHPFVAATSLREGFYWSWKEQQFSEEARRQQQSDIGNSRGQESSTMPLISEKSSGKSTMMTLVFDWKDQDPARRSKTKRLVQQANGQWQCTLSPAIDGKPLPPSVGVGSSEKEAKEAAASDFMAKRRSEELAAVPLSGKARQSDANPSSTPAQPVSSVAQQAAASSTFGGSATVVSKSSKTTKTAMTLLDEWKNRNNVKKIQRQFSLLLNGDSSHSSCSMSATLNGQTYSSQGNGSTEKEAKDQAARSLLNQLQQQGVF